MTQLRLAYSRKTTPATSDDSPHSLTLLSVRSKMLPVVSLEQWRVRRLVTRIVSLTNSPDDFTTVERLVERLTEMEDTGQDVGQLAK